MDWRITQRVLAHLLGTSPQRIEAFGVVTLLYAALYAVEGTGLWLQRRGPSS